MHNTVLKMNGLYIVSLKDLMIIHVLYYVAPYVQCSLGIYVLAFCETLEFYRDKQTFYGSSYHNMHYAPSYRVSHSATI